MPPEGEVPKSQFKPFEEVVERKFVPVTEALPFNHPSVAYAALGTQSDVGDDAAVCVLKSYMVLIHVAPPEAAFWEDIEAMELFAIALTSRSVEKLWPLILSMTLAILGEFYPVLRRVEEDYVGV